LFVVGYFAPVAGVVDFVYCFWGLVAGLVGFVGVDYFVACTVFFWWGAWVAASVWIGHEAGEGDVACVWGGLDVDFAG